MAGAVLLRCLLHLWPRRLAPTTSSIGVRICLVHTDLPFLCHYPPWKTLPVRALHLCSYLCAGHNKWSKVKHIKGPKDAARSRMYQKLGLMIRIAIKEGGSAKPELNLNLAQVLEQCRSKNMPKASMEAILKNAEKAKAGTQHTYEARGPGGCTLLIEILTDNNVRSLQEIRHLLNKNGGALADGARHNFNRKGVVMAHGEGVAPERALELAIEAGAEDVQETEDEEEKPLLQFICDLTELKNVRTSLEELGIGIVSAGLAFVPHTPAPLPQAQLEAASTLIEALNDCADVVRVWDNIQAQS